MNTEAKPFLKWAGGKGQLLSQLSEHLPDRIHREPFTYIEPFVGGGAMLFYMLQRFDNIKNVIINDVNEDLILAYRTIKWRKNIWTLLIQTNEVSCSMRYENDIINVLAIVLNAYRNYYF